MTLRELFDAANARDVELQRRRDHPIAAAMLELLDAVKRCDVRRVAGLLWIWAQVGYVRAHNTGLMIAIEIKRFCRKLR